MTFAGLFGFIAILLAATGTGEAEQSVRRPQASAQVQPPVRMMTVRQETILRVPVRPNPRMRLRWEEEKGPKCLPVSAIAGAVLSSPDSIDILLRNRQRMRAKLDNDCDGLDFYGSLYLQTDDGKFCAKRDSIHSRMGRTCRIQKFRTLVPKVER
ncbi:MAG: hypothetical protein V4696_13505 [Pseudomonadota bacterium]